MADSTRHPWRTGAGVGAVLGLLVAGLMMYIAWVHNAQGEIHNELGVSWVYWFFLGFSWFAPVALLTFLIVGAVISLRGRARGSSAA